MRILHFFSSFSLKAGVSLLLFFFVPLAKKYTNPCTYTVSLISPVDHRHKSDFPDKCSGVCFGPQNIPLSEISRDPKSQCYPNSRQQRNRSPPSRRKKGREGEQTDKLTDPTLYSPTFSIQVSPSPLFYLSFFHLRFIGFVLLQYFLFLSPIINVSCAKIAHVA